VRRLQASNRQSAINGDLPQAQRCGTQGDTMATIHTPKHGRPEALLLGFLLLVQEMSDGTFKSDANR
jgi:hypothetical protein